MYLNTQIDKIKRTFRKTYKQSVLKSTQITPFFAFNPTIKVPVTKTSLGADTIYKSSHPPLIFLIQRCLIQAQHL